MIRPLDRAEERSERAGDRAAERPVFTPPPFVRRLLRIPLFHKLLLANVAVVTVAVGAAVWFLLARPPEASLLSGGLAWLLAAGAVLLGAALANGLVLRIALSPLDHLEGVARSVSDGDTERRAVVSPVADARLERLTHTFNEMLERTVSYQRRLRVLAARALDAQEEERKRVSRELHDDTGQRLATALMRLGAIRAKGVEPETAEGLDGLREELAEAVEALRAFARDLRPPALSELGLVPAIDAYLRSVRERTSLSVELDPPLREPDLEPEVELAAYRIVQEAVSNAARHASPERVVVRITVTDGDVSLTVEDDGVGFRPRDVLQRREEGMGIFGMEERAAYVGGRLRVESRPGDGTRISIVVPRGRSAFEEAAAANGAPDVRLPAATRS